MSEILMHGSSQNLKIICDDGEVFCDRLPFVLWSKNWRNILDPNEELSVLICPDMKKGILELVLKILMTGESSGLEKDFENFFETLLEICQRVFQTSKLLRNQLRIKQRNSLLLGILLKD